jgi:hypothetical protein
MLATRLLPGEGGIYGDPNRLSFMVQIYRLADVFAAACG